MEDCTGCELCVQACPVGAPDNPERKAINLAARVPLVAAEPVNCTYFHSLPEADRSRLTPPPRSSQLLQPLFEFSGACAGCGETPYVKLVSQLFGDRLMVANATGCSSIYGGNLPTTPWTSNSTGADRPGLTRCSRTTPSSASACADRRQAQRDRPKLPDAPAPRSATIWWPASSARAIHDAGIARPARPRRRAEAAAGRRLTGPARLVLLTVADHLVRRSVWIVGGDGWAYDIGYGGLDHVLATGRNVNVLVLDTEVYSNTGGQASKSTRWAPSPSSPPPARPCRRRTSRCRRSPTATSTSPASRWAPTRSRPSMPSAKPRPTTGRR